MKKLRIMGVPKFLAFCFERKDGKNEKVLPTITS